jgi:hypothetical protein
MKPLTALGIFNESVVDTYKSPPISHLLTIPHAIGGFRLIAVRRRGNTAQKPSKPAPGLVARPVRILFALPAERGAPFRLIVWLVGPGGASNVKLERRVDRRRPVTDIASRPDCLHKVFDVDIVDGKKQASK